MPPRPPLRLVIGDREINLTQVLKLANWVENGGEAKALIAEGCVKVNGQVETRKRRRMTVGDRVILEASSTLELVLVGKTDEAPPAETAPVAAPPPPPSIPPSPPPRPVASRPILRPRRPMGLKRTASPRERPPEVP